MLKMSELRRSRLSAASLDDQGRSVSPEGRQRSMRSFSSTSTIDSISIEGIPSLPLVVSVRECVLQRRPANATVPGRGFVLRGTTSELAERTKIYTCHIESVHDNGTAKIAGLRERDQIVSIDGKQVKHREHSDVVKMFQTRDDVSLVVLPARFKTCTQARITQSNMITLNYLWALMRHLRTLEIINVNLSEDRPEAIADADFVGLVSLRSLSMNHCSLTTLDTLKGLGELRKLESLSLAHNFLSHQVLTSSSVLSKLTQLKRLDLSRNLLNCVPEVIPTMTNLEVVVLADNNISELPMMLRRLAKLHTLCLDGNLLREVDKSLSVLPCLQKVTVSNNQLECESQAVKLKEFLVASVAGNPYTKPDAETGLVTRARPSLRRTLSVRGQLFTPKKENRNSVEWDKANFNLSEYTATQ